MFNKYKITLHLKAYAISVIIEILTTPIRFNTLMHDIWITLTIFAIATILLGKRHKNHLSVLLGFVCGIVTIYLIGLLMDGFNDTKISIPNLIFHILGVLSGYLFLRIQPSLLKTAPFIITVCLAWFYISKLSPYWHNYASHSSFSGEESTQIPLGWYVYSKGNDTFRNRDYANKTVILDFWNTSCGVCFRKFPMLQKQYDELSENPDVIIQAVNIALERDSPKVAFEILSAKGYTFPNLKASKNMDSIFGIVVYPTVLILQNNKIVFRGNIETAIARLPSILSRQKVAGN